MEALLAIMLRRRDRAFEQVRLYEENSDECKLKDDYEFAFTGGWLEAFNYMIETAEDMLHEYEEENTDE